MHSHLWNSKLIAASCALAAAGLLACAVATLDALMPRGSVAGFLVGMVLLALVVTGVVIGYAWVCDQCERFFRAQLDRVLHGKTNRSCAMKSAAAMSPQPAEPRIVGDTRPAPGASQPLSRGRRTPMPRGPLSPKQSP